MSKRWNGAIRGGIIGVMVGFLMVTPPESTTSVDIMSGCCGACTGAGAGAFMGIIIGALVEMQNSE